MKKDSDFTVDCIAMKRSIQEEIAGEMKGMTPTERLAYVREQVRNGPFAQLLENKKTGSASR